jgi:membrane protein DedA with SNARE-associated domain
MSFIEPSVYLIKDLIATVGYPGLALLMALDATILPVPSAVVLGFAGYLCYEGSFDLALVIVVGALGSMVGSFPLYLLGRWGGRPFLDRFGRYFGLKKERVARAEGWFERYGSWSVLLCQLLPIMRDLVPFPAGLVQMRVSRFAVLSMLGSLVFCLALASIGFLAGPSWEAAVQVIDRYDVVVVAMIAVMIVAYFAYRRLNKKSGASPESFNPPTK